MGDIQDQLLYIYTYYPIASTLVQSITGQWLPTERIVVYNYYNGHMDGNVSERSNYYYNTTGNLRYYKKLTILIQDRDIHGE